ncbi:hypothetical protein D9756_011119 [Leucocoprinus leucothites]|uniref:Uncharacterized protein n=1 Tax=Leucocoprinus leucothites TaxID=201217 RepID=A0A8H5FSH8_9AGAR|nr:hypothetical protein D9756_011119 [Leucoagaricus leucothites]
MSFRDPNEPFPITTAQLLGNFCETLAYGVYLVTCTFCARTLFLVGKGQEERWASPHEIRWLMATIAMALFIICTFDVAIGLLHNMRAFIQSKDPERVFYNIADWINIVRSVDQVLAGILGDFVLVYRCWIVYGRRWLIIVPSLMLYLGGIVVAIALIQAEANPKTPDDILLTSNQTRHWNSAFFALTAAQNILTSSILIWRLWRMDREVERCINRNLLDYSRPPLLRKTIRVIAESGAAYTMTVFFASVASISRSNAVYPISDTALQATGIAFNVILIRSPMKRDQQFAKFDRTTDASDLVA